MDTANGSGQVALLNGSNSSTPLELIPYHPFFTHFSDTVRVLVALTIMIFGCVANIVSLLGLSHSRINQIPRGLLIIFISVADNLYLTSALVVEMADTFTLTLRPGCPYLYAMSHAIKLWSYSLVVLFLFDRVLSVKCVSWYRKLSSNYWTRFFVCVSLALSCCTSAFLLVFVHYNVSSSQACVVLYPYYEWFSWYLGIALLGFGEVALELAALVCTGWIVYSLVLGPEKPRAKTPPEKPEPDKKNGIEVNDVKTADIKRDSISKSNPDLESAEKPSEDIEMKEISDQVKAEGSTGTEEEEQKDEDTNVCACKYAPDYCVEASVVGAAMVIFCVPQTISFMYFHVRLPSQPLGGSRWFPHALIVTQTLSLAFHGIKLVLYLCSSRAFRRSLYHICCSCWLR